MNEAIDQAKFLTYLANEGKTKKRKAEALSVINKPNDESKRKVIVQKFKEVRNTKPLSENDAQQQQQVVEDEISNEYAASILAEITNLQPNIRIENVPLVDDEEDTDEDDEEENNENNKVTRKRKRKTWKFEESYLSYNDALDVIKAEATWKERKTISGKKCVKVYFVCKSKGCPAELHVSFHSDESSVSIFSNTDDHDHTSFTKQRGVPSHLRDYIWSLYSKNCSPKNIRYAIREEFQLEIDQDVINNFLSYKRTKQAGPANITFGELEEFCKKFIKIDDDAHEPYCVAFNININNLIPEATTFQVCFTTPYLLGIALKGNHLGVDTTYKLIFQGYPVFVICVNDNHRKVHPVMIGICTHETHSEFAFMFQSLKKAIKDTFNLEFKPDVLLADAIKNGFKETFGENFTRVMCYAHVDRAEDNYLRIIGDTEARSQIKGDIGKLHLASSDELFDYLYDKFVDKWVLCACNKADESIIKFLEYFHKEWYASKNRGWHEGIAPRVPSHNNGVESNNNDIKRKRNICVNI